MAKIKTVFMFIVGSGHCGSTLLDLILDSHSQIVGVGELDNFEKTHNCTCGREFNSCELWGKVLRYINLKNLKVRRSKKNFLLNKKEVSVKNSDELDGLKNIDGWLKINEKIYNKILETSNTRVMADSSKSADRAEILGKSENIEPIIVHLVRDGKAVTWSYIKKYKKALPYMWKWFASNIKTEIVKRRNNFKYIFVRYEDLTRKPEQVIKKILTEIDLEYEPEMLDFRNFIHHQIGGNRMRFKKDSKIKEDIEWKQKMPRKYKILFNLLFGWLNFYYKHKK